MRSTFISVAVAAFVGFLIGAAWYSPLLFGNVYAQLRGVSASPAAPPPSEIVLEFIRCVIVAATFAYFVHRLGVTTLTAAVQLAVVVWFGFQAFVLSGATLHEGYPVRLFAIHAGDALAKAVTYCVILVLMLRRTMEAVPTTGS